MKIKSMLLGALALVCACTSGEETKELGVNGVSHGAAARKLQTCGFLLNKDFKENAKYYLCLFSASWCGPCRAEMPRIAKTYAESLKADPNIELIHFSRDNDENKALAWAKEHDVKFPVVKPKGGNPLDLHSRGIPHLFIVDADGKLLEEGHPAKLFTNEKLNALKAGKLAAPETSTEKTRKAIAKLFPGWSLDTEVWDHDFAGIQPLIRGKRNVTFVHPKNRETPSVISRTVKLSGNNPCLSLCVASWNDDADFQLSVRVNGMDALTNRIVCTTDAAPWEDIVVPLSAWRGSTAKIEVVFTAYGRWWCEFPNLARVDIVEADVKEGKCEVDGYTWSYRMQNGEATIVAENEGWFSTAVSPCPVGNLTIPATIAGAKVTHIGRDAFLDCSALTSVTIPEGVSRIGREAFRDCTGLKSIKIPSSVKIIERDAFMGCVALSSVSIPEGVTIIDRGAFIRCYGLESIEIPSSVTQIGRDAFCNCGKLTSVTIPEKVTDIGYGAFHGCNALTSVTIPASVTNINLVAFRNTGALTSFHVDPGNRCYKSENGLLLTKDGTTLVRGVNGDATIPPSVTAIGTCAFEGCVALRSAEIPSGVKSIGPFAFKQCRGLKSVTIPSSVTEIGHEAFYNCKGLKSIAIPQGVTVIRNSTFTGSALTEVVIPANVKVLERGAFSWCGELKSVTFPEGMTIIGRDAFYNCGKLTSLIIPSSVQRIEQGAFHGCGSLTSVTMRGERPDAPNNIFNGCGKLKSIHVPANAKSWTGMKDWCGIPLVFDANGVYCVIDISGGSNAERYPVSYLDSVPKGGWGDEYKTTKIVLRRVDAGTYPMLGNRKVTFTKPFYIGIFELTQKQIKLLSGDNNRKFVFEGDMRPADCLTWDEMRGKNEEFDYPKTKEVAPNSIIGKLRAKTGLVRIDLPTSYQFDCAWNAGTDGSGRDARSTGRHYGNQRDGKGGYTSKHTIVGSYLPNEWGIYDLHGNVWEMCLDYTGKQSAEDESDPAGPVEGAKRQLRGGCWNSADGFVFGEFVPQNKEANDQTGNHGKHGCRIVINVEAPETATEKTRKVQRRADAERQQQLEALRQIQEELRRQREAKQAEKEVGASGIQTDSKHVTASNVLTGPYGIRVEPDPGCEKGAEYVLKRLVDDYLPAAVRYYGDPFGGKEPSRVFTLKVKRNDGKDRKYTGPSWGSRGDGTSQFTIGLAKGSDKWDMDLTLVANKILTVCREDVGFSLYVNDLVRGDAKGIDPVPGIKEMIRKGLSKEGDAKKDVRLRVWREYAPMWAAFEELRARHPKFMLDYCNLKNSRYAEGKLPQKLSFDQMADLLGEVTGENMVELFKKHGVGSRESQKYPLPKISVAQALQGCDFLLNKDFKKNAKYYLCLFSASWCGPCRAEMPRIAKTYAETLKNDPNIELIHFSRDNDENKALAWAKEHDVKFPVVKPKGGNPLDLRARGIPHLFIVNADGTLVEEGHPMKLFTDEKLRELKTANGGDEAKDKAKMASSGKEIEIIDGVEWTYSIQDGKAQVDYASSSNVTGSITIPSTLGGCPVTSIRGRQYGQPGVFGKCSKLTSVTIPSSVTSIGERAFESCRELRTVTIQSNATSIGSFAFFGCDSLVSFVIPSGVTSIGWRAFCHCRGLTSVTIPASVKRIEREAFLSCDNLMSISVEPDNPSYSSRNGLLCSKDGSILVAGVNGDVTIPSSVTRIEDGAFDGYSGLTGVTIPSSVTRIGKRAFAICRRLTSVKIPSSVTSIGGDAFNGTPFYRNMPDGMVVLGGGVLCGYKGKCPSTVVIPSNVRSIADSAFSEEELRGLIMRRRGAGLGLKMLEISSSVTNIGNCAFSYCGDLTNVTMRGERPDAPNNIFQGCGKLKSIHVPANAKSWAGMKEWQGIPLVFDGKDDAVARSPADMNGAYCVIDISGGSNAEHYPVSYLAAEPKGGWTDEHKTTKLVLRRIEPGKFKMRGQYEVTLTKPFYCGVFEVTQKQYELVMGNNPSEFKGDMRPVESVSWGMIRGDSAKYNWPSSANVDSSSFIGKIRVRTGLKFDLPTEAQWEYACRAGTTSKFNNGGDSETDLKKLGRCNGNQSDGKGGNSSHHTTVGSYEPNRWGLYDMHGNVWEACLDWRGNMSSGVTDPQGPSSGAVRVARGGCWRSSMSHCVPSYQDGNMSPSDRYDCGIGFRVCIGAPLGDWNNATTTSPKLVKDAFSLNVAPGSITELDLGNVAPLQFVYCPAGKFSMGYKEQPALSKVKDIEISSPFWVSKTPLRVDQLASLGLNSITDTRIGAAGIDDVSIVIQKLPSVLKEHFGKMLPPGYVFRLPTEAEFEYLQKSETKDKDAPTNIWGVERLYSGGIIALLDRAPA